MFRVNNGFSYNSIFDFVFKFFNDFYEVYVTRNEYVVLFSILSHTLIRIMECGTRDQVKWISVALQVLLDNLEN